jgi:hypothetical protein
MNGAQCPQSSRQFDSGLVITLSQDPALARDARAALANRPEIQLGEQRGRWLAAALRVGNPRDEHAWIEQLPGVELVEVVFVGFGENFEEDDAAAETGPRQDPFPIITKEF